MTAIVLHLISLSVKIALLGGIAWGQLYLLRRGSAVSRSRLCAVTLAAISLLGSVEWLAPTWTVKAPAFSFTGSAQILTNTPAASPVASWIAIVWIAGAGLMLIRVVTGRTALVILRRRSMLLQQDSGIEIRIGGVQTPVVTGLLHPAILLPESARRWTDEQRSMVLRHEFTHLRQGDGWTNLLAQILRAIFWFHPGVWLLVSRLSREQELTCDEAVISSGYSRQEYAAFLLDAVRNLQSREMFACSMAGSGARSLKHRFAKLLDPMPQVALTRRIAVIAASFAVAVMALTLVRPVWAQTGGGSGKVYKIGNGVFAPKLLTKVEPAYTQEAKAAGIEGTVRLILIVTAEGKPDSIEVTSGIDPGLDQNAMDAVSQWTFQPATKDGKPVAVSATVEVNFRLK